MTPMSDTVDQPRRVPGGPTSPSGSVQVPPGVADLGGRPHPNSVVPNVLWSRLGLCVLGPPAARRLGSGPVRTVGRGHWPCLLAPSTPRFPQVRTPARSARP